MSASVGAKNQHTAQHNLNYYFNFHLSIWLFTVKTMRQGAMTNFTLYCCIYHTNSIIINSNIYDPHKIFTIYIKSMLD